MEPLSSEAFADRLKSSIELTDCEFYQRVVGSELFVPGDIDRAFSLFKNTRGQTSYEILVEAVPELNEKVVVDLAAGSGPVARAVLARAPGVDTIHLVDFNARELNVARINLTGAPTAFLEEPVQSLSLPDESVDVVFCHLGLMLFRPLDSALDSITRILKPESPFVFNTFREEIGAVESAYLDVIIRYEDQIPHFTDHGYGDSRTHTEEALTAVLARHGFEAFTTYEYEVSYTATPEALYEALKTYYQLGYLLDEAVALTLKEELLKVLRGGVDATGTATFTLPLSLVTCRKC